MAASVFDSPMHAQLFPTGEAGRLFSDSAALRAMLLVEGALAKAQGSLGIIPEISAAAIHRASLEIQIDPGALAEATGRNGVCVPGLVAAFRAEMQAPEHAQYVHWGATSQDIIDTGLMLRLRQTLALAEADLLATVRRLGRDAEAHAETVMAGRTYGQLATPTTWGAVLSQWGMPLLDALDALPRLREDSLWVSLSGASGTSAALGPEARALRAELAKNLRLADPGRSWHTDRGPLLRIAEWMARVTSTLGAMGSTIVGLSASGIGEVLYADAGASSTMPQKQNPVAASALVALSHQQAAALNALRTAAMHQHQRDGAAWFTEWMAVPQLALSTASALQMAKRLAGQMTPDVERMRRTLDGSHGTVQAEALSFALSARMPRPEAQAAVKALCADAIARQTPLVDLAQAAYPDLPASCFEPLAQAGQAPAEARAFAQRAQSL
jgi:3-carboxy-cis,cis-muconate cycloisomerase